MHLVSRILGPLIVFGLVACGPTEEVLSKPGVSTHTVDAGESRSPAVVVRVIDGDTLIVKLGEVDTTIRLLNVDTPEAKHPNKAVECLGTEASRFLAELLPAGSAVELEYDGEKLDVYGRTLAGVWLRHTLVNAEIARAGLGVPVQYNGQVKFLPPVEQAAAEAKRLKHGAHADHVACALPAKVDAALSSTRKVKEPGSQTAAAYATAIVALTSARKAATDVKQLTKKSQRANGAAAWVFHDAVRAAQHSHVRSGITTADDRLKDLRSSQKRLKKKELATERKRQRALEQARQQRQAEREQAAQAPEAARDREAEAQRQRQQREQEGSKRRSDSNGSGRSNPPGYTGPRCYGPGGQIWHPC
jgi:micrococcal nuclease